MSIIRINEFQATVGKEKALLDFIASLMPYIQNSTGCISCELLQQEEQLGHLVVIEKWQSIADHKASIAQFPKEKMMEAMPLFAAPPTGNYFIACT